MSKPKKVVQKEHVNGKKKPMAVENPISFYQMTPVWSFKLLDNGYMKWGFVHTDDVNSAIISKLKDYEGLTWGEIMHATGGRGHGNNNHYEDVADLIPEAQERWLDLKLGEYDRVFSLRLTAVERLYGILENGIFKIIWYDQRHEIYPIKK